MFKNKSLFILVLYLFIVFTSLRSANITQIEVARQKSSGSCGYHALRNGLLIAESFKSPSSRQLLTNESILEEFENSDSNWYKSIIKYRSQKLAAYYIKDSILRKVKGRVLKDSSTSNRSYALNLENKYIELKELKDLTYPDERHFFCNLLIETANRLSKEVASNFNTEAKYEVSRQLIIEVLKKEIKKHEPGYNQSNLSEKMKYFFPKLKTIEFSVVSDNVIKNSKDETIYRIDYRINNTREICSSVANSGEWLSSQEITRLIQEEYSKNNSFLSKNLNKVKVFVLDDQFEQQFKHQEDLRELVGNLQKDNFDGIAIFIVYYSSHWITCVVNKQKNKTIDYIFADSLNIDRLQDENTLKLINLLSGNSNDEDDIDGSEIKVEYTKTNLPPLEILLQGRGFMVARHIISQLKKNECIKQGLLLQGPSGVGKHTIAQVIAQQSGRELISTLQEEVKASLKSDIDEDKEIEKEVILLNLIKKAYKARAILLICEIEKFLQTKAINRLSRIAYKNAPFLVIGITKDNSLVRHNEILKKFLNPVSIELPSFDLRQNILRFYLDLERDFHLSLKRSDYSLSSLDFDALTTAMRNYSGSEIEDIATNALDEFNKNAEITNPSSYFYRFKQNYDFKDRKAISLLYSVGFVGALMGAPVLDYFATSKLEEYLWAVLQAYDQEREKKVETGYLDKAKKLGLITKDYTIYYGKEALIKGVDFAKEVGGELIKEEGKEIAKKGLKKLVDKRLSNIKEKIGLNDDKIKELTVDEMINKNLNNSKEKVAELIANDIITKKTLPELRKKWGLKDKKL